MSRESVVGYSSAALPGVESLRTDAAREIANRTQFAGGFGSKGNYVYANGHDLARVEAAGLRDPAIFAVLERHGWESPDPGLRWFKKGDGTFAPYTLADAILTVIAEMEVAPKQRSKSAPVATEETP